MASELAVQQISPLEILQNAVNSGAAIDTIERLAKLATEFRDYDAKVAFDQAMQQAQLGMRHIGADATNPQTRSRYVTYAKLDSVMRPIYSKNGFAVSFNTAECSADMVRVIAYVSHENGHTRTYQIDMPADGKGAKGGDVMTKTHATGAATSYGMRYLLKMIFNVAVGETDDDGNGAAQSGTGMDEKEFAEWDEKIQGAVDLDTLKKVHAAAYVAAQKLGDQGAIRSFTKSKDERKKELANA
jgi:hypothetical protein